MDIPVTLIFEEGCIIFIRDYEYDDGSEPTNKILIILHKTANNPSMLLFSLTTSQDKHLPEKLMHKHGCTRNTQSDIHFYMFEKDKIVGVSDDFSFNKDTYVFFHGNVIKKNIDDLKKYDEKGDLKIMNKLNSIEFSRFLKCIEGSHHVRQVHKPLIAATRKALSESGNGSETLTTV